MSQSINFDPIRLPPEAEELRLEVREFLADHVKSFEVNEARKQAAEAAAAAANPSISDPQV